MGSSVSSTIEHGRHNNSGGSSHTTVSTMSEKEKLAEAAVWTRFRKALEWKMDALRPSPDAAHNSNNSRQLVDALMGVEIRRILQQIDHFGWREGSVVGIVTMMGLRRFRFLYVQRFLQKQQKQKQQTRKQQQQHGISSVAAAAAETTTSKTPNKHCFKQHVRNSPFEPHKQQQQLSSSSAGSTASSSSSSSSDTTRASSLLHHFGNSYFSWMNVFDWVLDLTIAFSIAGSAAVLLADQNKIMTKLAQIPLSAGRSIVAEEFCPVATQTARDVLFHDDYGTPRRRRFDQDDDDDDKNNDDESLRKQRRTTTTMDVPYYYEEQATTTATTTTTMTAQDTQEEEKQALVAPKSTRVAALAEFTRNCQCRALYQKYLFQQQQQQQQQQQHGDADLVVVADGGGGASAADDSDNDNDRRQRTLLRAQEIPLPGVPKTIIPENIPLDELLLFVSKNGDEF